jgi:uncharacterized membrane protein HdeD (DUF308 family)
MTMPLDAAAQAMRAAMRETIRRYALAYFTQGGLMILAGVLALAYPIFSSAGIVVVLGWLLIVSGAFQAIGLVGARHLPQFWLQAISVVLFAIVGLLLLNNASANLFALALLLVLFLLVEGVAKAIFALAVRPFPRWVWVLAGGVLAILLAFYLWSQIGGASTQLLSIVLGVALIGEGAAIAYLAMGSGRTP